MTDDSPMRKLVVYALLGSFTMSGCTQTVVRRLAAYQPGEQPTTRPVPEVAMYKVKVYDNDGSGKLHGIDGTERVLGPGDVVGFRTDESGQVQAIANNVSIPLALTPGRKVVWYTRYQKPTEFGKGFGRALETTGDVVGTAAIIALVGVAVGAGLALGDEDVDQTQTHRHHHKH